MRFATRSAMTKSLPTSSPSCSPRPHCFAALAALVLGLVLGLPGAARSDSGALDVATLRFA